MSERVCHTMQGVREASSSVPKIGTADTSGKRATNEEYSQDSRAEERATCETRVPGVFRSFCAQKEHKERLQIEYTTEV